jgi:GT2 family glycosyltransferase
MSEYDSDYVPHVVILVLNYCSYEDTIACVSAIHQQDYASFEVVVLDNSSPDGSGLRLRESLKRSTFIQNNTNLGYSGGNNVGIRLSFDRHADYVLILNPDVRVAADCLSRLVAELQKDSNRAGAMPLQMNEGNHVIDWRVEQGLLPSAGYSPDSSEWRGQPWLPLPVLLGAALLLSCEALRRVGTFDPMYFCYGEEEDLCRRLRFHGFELGMVPGATVEHRRTYELEGEDPKLAERREYLRTRNWFLLHLKDPAKPVWWNLIPVTGSIAYSLLGAIIRRDGAKLRRIVQAMGGFIANAATAVRHRDEDRRGYGGYLLDAQLRTHFD